MPPKKTAPEPVEKKPMTPEQKANDDFVAALLARAPNGLRSTAYLESIQRAENPKRSGR